MRQVSETWRERASDELCGRPGTAPREGNPMMDDYKMQTDTSGMNNARNNRPVRGRRSLDLRGPVPCFEPAAIQNSSAVGIASKSHPRLFRCAVSGYQIAALVKPLVME